MSVYEPSGPSVPKLILISVAWNDYEHIFSTLLDGMLVHRRVTPSILIRRYPFIRLGGVRQCESQVSSPRTQGNVPARAQIQTALSGVECANHEATVHLPPPTIISIHLTNTVLCIELVFRVLVSTCMYLAALVKSRSWLSFPPSLSRFPSGFKTMINSLCSYQSRCKFTYSISWLERNIIILILESRNEYNTNWS